MVVHGDYFCVWDRHPVWDHLVPLSVLTDCGFYGQGYVRLEHNFSLYNSLSHQKAGSGEAHRLYWVYIHGPLEVPDISTKRHYADENYYMKIYVTAMTVYTSPEAARLSVGQRRCRFLHENSLKHNSVYTYNMCRMECRLRLCLKYCKCVPFFYRNGKEKICDVDGMQCLAKYKDDLIKLRTKDGKKVSCECLPICDDVNYIVQSHALHEWFLGTFFQWGIVTYPRMRYRRDIIFGFTDVLVAVGGMAGLFLGCSVLSFMEIVYFLTLRLFWYARRG
ncbi:hypothetical protein KGM_210227 [Danaus plexippus plexippus]|uniref:Sodium channel protein Nach-like n=1 Tax=Danaus plexippus plexippus TaxID=278856 RepID=A0A212F4Y2_DANPL|nr:hypothetical protein KGM_210227 [Danaus plexippus plexippus]